MIKDAIAIYPVYTVPAPSPLKHFIFSDTTTSNNADSIMPHGLTGVDQVHQKLNNFGKGVRVRKSQVCESSLFVLQKRNDHRKSLLMDYYNQNVRFHILERSNQRFLLVTDFSR
jgi:hypothetical protein